MIVKPIKAEDCQSRQNDPLFKALQVSGSKQSKYNLTTSDRENGFYFIYKGLEVPFKVLFNMNQKTEGILGVAFGTAKDCPSQALGLCQLPNDKLCYARNERPAKTTKTALKVWTVILTGFYALIFGIYTKPTKKPATTSKPF